MKAVILCAGNGERLKPICKETPKPLFNVGGKLILEHIFLSLPDEISEVFLVVKDKHKILFEKFLKQIHTNKKVSILYQDINEKGTYFALMSAKNNLEKEELFLVLNGDDIFLKRDLAQLIKEKAPCYALSYKKLDRRYRTCDLNLENRKILSFRKQKDEESEKEIPCFSGALTLTGEFFSYDPVFYENNEAGIPHTLFNNNKNVSFFILEEWLQINNKEDVDIAKEYMARK